MIILRNYEGKNIEVMLESIIEENKISKEDLFYKANEDKMGLFLNKKRVISFITKQEIVAYLKKYITDLSDKMNIKIEIQINIENDIINVLLNSDHNDVLIGKDGKTLSAIQVLLRNNLKELNKFNLKVMVDVADYRKKQISNLEKEVKKICIELLSTKSEVKLDPMNSYERRIVHSIVSNYGNLNSHSEGEEPYRYTIINYKD